MDFNSIIAFLFFRYRNNAEENITLQLLPSYIFIFDIWWYITHAYYLKIFIDI